MKVMVTGANGFLGSWLTRRLTNEGHEVSILVRSNSDLSEIEDLRPRVCYGDVTDPTTLLTHFAGQEAIFHLAGVVAYRKADRPLMERVNVDGTHYVTQVCREYKIPRLVYVSSVVAVGAGFTANDVLNEESPYNIAHLDLGYFETKRKAELDVIQSCKKKEIDAVIVNPGTIYGPGDARKDSRKTQLKVAQGRFPFYTQGGICGVAIDDVIDGIMAAWKVGKSGERYILGGENITIKDLFERIAHFSGVPAPKRELPQWLLMALGSIGDTMDLVGLKGPISTENAWTATLYHWFDCSKAKRDLGYKTSDFNKALEASIRWSKDNGLLNR